MSYIPASLAELATYWTKQGGVSLGVIGNQKHCAGYHLGKDRIFSDCACKPDGTCEPGRRWSDYSVSLARDKAGLTNAASAIDLGKLNGTLDNLYAFSRWLVAQCQAKATGYADVREVIYSPDGDRVQRYSGVDGLVHTGPGNGDASHKTHTHISYFRDSEKRDKTALFRTYFAAPQEPDVPGVAYEFEDTARSGWFTVVGEGHSYLNLSTGELVGIPGGSRKRAFGPVTLIGRGIGGPTDPRKNGYVINRTAAFMITDDGVWEVDSTPDEAVNAALDYVEGPALSTVAAINEARPR